MNNNLWEKLRIILKFLTFFHISSYVTLSRSVFTLLVHLLGSKSVDVLVDSLRFPLGWFDFTQAKFHENQHPLMKSHVRAVHWSQITCFLLWEESGVWFLPGFVTTLKMERQDLHLLRTTAIIWDIYPAKAFLQDFKATSCKQCVCLWLCRWEETERNSEPAPDQFRFRGYVAIVTDSGFKLPLLLKQVGVNTLSCLLSTLPSQNRQHGVSPHPWVNKLCIVTKPASWNGPLACGRNAESDRVR